MWNKWKPIICLSSLYVYRHRKQRNKPKREQSQSTSQQRTTTSEQNRQETDILTEQETGDSISLYVNIPTPRLSRAENIVKPSLAKEQSHTYDNVPTDVNELSENKSSKRPKAQGLANLGSDRNAVATVVQSHHQTNPIFSRVKEVSNSKNESLLNADDQVHYLSLCESSRSDNEDQLYESYTPEMTLYENVWLVNRYVYYFLWLNLFCVFWSEI